MMESGGMAMTTVTIDVNELPTRYAEAVSRAERGEDVLVTASGQRPFRLVPVPTCPTRPRILGMHPGSMSMPPDFDEPLPDDFWLGQS
jgi:antitoxin (DNA-binding transcriptional repressor) of toxin-antitoxin stability system